MWKGNISNLALCKHVRMSVHEGTIKTLLGMWTYNILLYLLLYSDQEKVWNEMWKYLFFYCKHNTIMYMSYYRMGLVIPAILLVKGQ